MKKSYILCLVLSLLITLSACSADTSASSASPSEFSPSESPSPVITEEESPSPSTSESEIESPSPEVSEEDESADTSKSMAEESEYKMVGDDAFGFLNVPSDWVVFLDERGTEDLQYSDPNGEYIVTLSHGGLYGYTSSETWANSVMAVMQSYGSTDGEGARVDFNGYDSYQCYGTFPDGTIWVANIFSIEDGQIRYVSVEGPTSSSDFFTLYETITGSYTIKSPAVG